jgi:hypothetical protein
LFIVISLSMARSNLAGKGPSMISVMLLFGLLLASLDTTGILIIMLILCYLTVLLKLST